MVIENNLVGTEGVFFFHIFYEERIRQLCWSAVAGVQVSQVVADAEPSDEHRRRDARSAG